MTADAASDADDQLERLRAYVRGLGIACAARRCRGARREAREAGVKLEPCGQCEECKRCALLGEALHVRDP